MVIKSLTPEASIDIQTKINSDIMMIFDECIKYPSDAYTTEQSMELSLDWAVRSLSSNYSNKTLFESCRRNVPITP